MPISSATELLDFKTQLQEWKEAGLLNAEECASFVFPFEVGDLVTGTSKSNKEYMYTTDESLVEVTGVDIEKGTFSGKMIAHKWAELDFPFNQEIPELKTECFRKATGKEIVSFDKLGERR